MIPSLTQVIPVPPGLSVGCTQCGDPAIQVIVYSDEFCMEVVEASCIKHSTVEEKENRIA